jgi:hypothetical protein
LQDRGYLRVLQKEKQTNVGQNVGQSFRKGGIKKGDLEAEMKL